MEQMGFDHSARRVSPLRTETGKQLVPTAQNARDYRKALGLFATGVTVITAAGSQGPIGMTANSFSSVSLDPALVLWSLAKSSGRFQPFAEAKHYSIHVLCDDQEDVALQFASEANAFTDAHWHFDSNKVPCFEEALVRFDCERHAVHDGGDHIIIVGKVLNVSQRAGDPLVFAKGAFGRFSS